MTCLKLIAGVIVLAVACKGPSEGERILRQLRSEDPQEVMYGIFAAQHLRERERNAGRLVPTGDNAMLVRELLAMLGRQILPRARESIAGSFAIAPIPGPQPELLECARTEWMGLAGRCFSALGEARDPANLAPLVDMLADPRIRTKWDSDLQAHRAILDERIAATNLAIDRYGDDAVPYLARLVKDGTPVARELALLALKDAKLDSAAEAAMPALSDPNHWIRFLAVDVIRLHAAHREVLRPLLDDPWLSIRQEVQNTFGLPIEPNPGPSGPTGVSPHDPDLP